jgi:hypothetical protein
LAPNRPINPEDLRKECAQRFRRITGRPWNDAVKAALDAELRTQRASELDAKVARELATALQNAARRAKEPDATEELRSWIAAHVDSLLASQADRLEALSFASRANERGALLWLFDDDDFFGRGKAATDSELAVLSILAGTAFELQAQHAGLTVAQLIDHEAKNIRKARAEYGLASKTETLRVASAMRKQVLDVAAPPGLARKKPDPAGR